MRRKNAFDFVEGKYYFTIRSYPNDITIHRKDKVNAVSAFMIYKAAGKDIEWHGKWDGKNFVESSNPQTK